MPPLDDTRLISVLLEKADVQQLIEAAFPHLAKELQPNLPPAFRTPGARALRAAGCDVCDFSQASAQDQHQRDGCSQTYGPIEACSQAVGPGRYNV